jgi:hypothetical protein
MQVCRLALELSGYDAFMASTIDDIDFAEANVAIRDKLVARIYVFLGERHGTRSMLARAFNISSRAVASAIDEYGEAARMAVARQEGAEEAPKEEEHHA